MYTELYTTNNNLDHCYIVFSYDIFYNTQPLGQSPTSVDQICVRTSFFPKYAN